ncbi:MAG: hypothetical protein IJ982_03515 [Fibrobacter sp.]|nr:hypothetical protein [Fibrobacter sp.]
MKSVKYNLPLQDDGNLSESKTQTTKKTKNTTDKITLENRPLIQQPNLSEICPDKKKAKQAISNGKTICKTMNKPHRPSP